MTGPGGAPTNLTTERLRLRKPTTEDAPAILQRYASDVEVTRLVAFRRHVSIEDTMAFLASSEHAWSVHGVGPYLMSDDAGTLVGSTGLDIETPHRASTGYVLARDAWGRGYATEATVAMAELATSLGITRLYALCHPRNRASARVLEKAGFEFEGVLRRHTICPNHDPKNPQDLECWARIS